MKMKKSFEYNSLLVFVITMITNVMAYFFQIVVAKMVLDVEMYGIVNTLLSLLSLFLVPGTLLTLVAARYTAIKMSSEKFTAIVRYLILIAFSFIVLLLIFTLGGANILSDILHLKQSVYIYEITIVAAISIASAVFIGILQGKQFFFAYSFQGTINSVMKLGTCFLLLYLGFNVDGVIGACLIGAVAAAVYVLLFCKRVLKKTDGPRFIVPREEKNDIIKYLCGIACIQLCTTLLFNGDLLLVKMFFDGQSAGLYASSMVIGKIATYASGAIISTVFPLAAAKKNENSLGIKKLLGKAILYGGGFSVFCALLINLFGEKIVTLFFGERYSGAMDYMLAVSFVIVPFTFLNITVSFLGAIGKTKVASITLALCSVLCMGSAMIIHDSILVMLISISVIILLIFIVNVIYFLIDNFKYERRIRENE